jgi:iron-sulfur cluster repair protein YtfE (RIC family)
LARLLRTRRAVTACSAKPLHRLTHELEHISHAALRGELSLIVALAKEELERPASRHAAVLHAFHTRARQLLDTVTNHFHREETRLFPAIRLAEDGLNSDPGRLVPLVLDLRREHVVIRARLDAVRDITDQRLHVSACPLVEMLLAGLATLADDLERHLDEEERVLFPNIVATWLGVSALAHAAPTSA